MSRPIRARKGMVVDIMDTDNDTKHLDSGTISAVVDTGTAYSITVSGTITSTGALDFFCREDTCDDSLNDALHMNGLLGIVDDADPATVVGDYGSIDRGTSGNEFWESAVLSNGGTNRSITEDLLLQSIHEARLKGGGDPDVILTNPSIFRRYYDLFSAEGVRERGSGMGGMKGSLGPAGARSANSMGDTGKTAFTFSGIPIYMDDFAPANTIFVLDSSTFRIGHGVNRTPQPVSMTFDGAAKFVDTTNTTFELPYWWQGELICSNPAASSKIEDVAES